MITATDKAITRLVQFKAKFNKTPTHLIVNLQDAKEFKDTKKFMGMSIITSVNEAESPKVTILY